jgi:hypothetical protein
LRRQHYHLRQPIGNDEGGILLKGLGPLGDAHGQVGDPLQVGVDLEHRGNSPQVHRHRLMEGKHFEALFLDMHLMLVDVGVGRDDLIRQAIAPLVQGLGRLVDHVLDHRRNPQQLLVDGLNVALQMSAHACIPSAEPGPCRGMTLFPPRQAAFCWQAALYHAA